MVDGKRHKARPLNTADLRTFRGFPDFRGLPEILAWRASRQPDQLSFQFLRDGQEPVAESVAASLTYAQLRQQVAVIAGRLNAALGESVDGVGPRVLLTFPPGLEFVAAFLACLWAGTIAVPLPPPGRRRGMQRFLEVLEDAEPAVILTVEAFTANVESTLAHWRADAKRPTVVAVDADAAVKPLATPATAEPAGTAFLQYTSGSTGSAKGVMVSHANLMDNLTRIRDTFGHDKDSRGVIWLPPYHDMGLIGGILQPLFVGFPVTLMAPAGFLRSPLRWLQAIDHFGATTSGGPDFAYRHSIERTTPGERAALDLSRWRVAFTGAEVVRDATLREFAGAFAASGFRQAAWLPCYGLAETTLIAAGNPVRQRPRVASLRRTELARGRAELSAPESDGTLSAVAVGPAVDGHEIRVVDPKTRVPVDERAVGEIWIRGPSVASGYWGREGESAATFQAFTEDGAGPFLRTGDLGFLDTGDLFVSGRLKELIILRGRNLYPTDIERSVEAAHPALGQAATAAFSVDTDGRERLVVVHEPPRRFDRSLVDEVLNAMRADLAEEFEIVPDAIVLLKPGRLPLTPSGKVQRLRCREQYFNDALESIASWRQPVAEDLSQQQPIPRPETISVESVQTWLQQWLAARLGCAPSDIDADRPLAELGLDSVVGVDLAAALGELVDREEPYTETLAWKYPTVAALAGYVTDVASRSVETAPADDVAPAALLTAELNANPETTRSMHAATRSEPVAIVGMACRFPGGADSPAAFWRLLDEAADAIGEIPAQRWDVDAFYDPDPAVPGRMYTRAGGFIDDVDAFDPQFFGISPREALNLDPQQRLLLECAYHALEDAGIPVDELRGSETGVFVGLSLDDYAQRNVRSGDPTRIDAHSALGSQRGVAAGRIAYAFGFHGPAMQLDTTCSSSLVSVHLACEALRRGEATLAVAGGVNLMLAPEATISCCKLKALSADGRCRTFAEDASGYGRGEGCGMLVLKTLAAAQKAGDQVLAVIRGSAVNHDGTSNGLTAPSATAQTRVIKAALANAGLAGSDIDYVEAHGTATPLGDPIELEALQAALGERDRPLQVGSVKTNIGHLESAAGVAGIIKVVLALQAGRIPAHLHCARPTPRFDWEAAQFAVPGQQIAWHSAGRVARAGVSSFGLSGTNAHVIMEAAPAAAGPAAAPQQASLLPLSARSGAALQLLASRYADRLEAGDDPVAITDAAARGRSHHRFREAFVGGDRAGLALALREFAATGVPAPTGELPRIVFLYTGQGAQFVGMGRELFATEPAFRRAIEACETWLLESRDMSLREVLYPAAGEQPPASDIDETGVTQPVLFALQYALTRLWASWGIRPDAVLGHSVGEFAAACAASVMPWRDGLRLSSERARLMQTLPRGAMLAVAASEADIGPWLNDELSLAAINSRSNVVVSGEDAAIDAFEEKCSELGISRRRLRVSHAFHSQMMAPVRPAFETAAAAIDYSPATVDWMSTVSGDRQTAAITPDHWGKQLCAPVLFQAALDALGDCDNTIFVEIGPQATLLAMARSAVPGAFRGLPSLRRPAKTGPGERATLLKALAEIYASGHRIDWRAFTQPRPRRHITLPVYPFARERYWLEQPTPMRYPATASASLPGRQLPLVGDTLRCYELTLTATSETGWHDHKVNGRVLWPAAAHAITALAAGRQDATAAPGTTLGISNLVLHEALWLSEERPLRVQTQLQRSGTGWQVSILSGADDDWTLHSACELENVREADLSRADLPSLNAAADEISADALYRGFAARGIAYGPRYRRLQRTSIGSDRVVASLSAAGASDEEIIDAGLQAAGALLRQRRGTPVPVAIEQLLVAGSLVTTDHIYVFRERGDTHIHWLAADGSVVAALKGLKVREIAARTGNSNRDDYCAEWQAAPLPMPAVERLLPPAEVASAAAAAFADELQRPAAKTYLDGLAELEKLSQAYLASSLEALAGSPVAAKHVALAQRIRAVADAQGAAPAAVETRTAKLRAEYPSLAAELALVERVGAALPAILRGATEPLEVLFPGGDSTLLHNLYADSPGAQLLNGQLKRALSHLLSPGARHPLRILEIGAGTGGTTVHVLEALAGMGVAVDYVFTDVSQQLLRAARERFATAAEMRFERLDIEQLPTGHERFDLVIASNVLHATANIESSLRHVRERLVPGGQVLLIEGTRRMAWLDLVFGVTEGWWRFSDTQRRPDHPLLDTEAWLQAFEESGYASSRALLPADGQRLAQTVFLAQAPVPARSWQLVGDTETSAALTEALQGAGQHVLSGPPDDNAVAAHTVFFLPPANDADPALLARDCARQVFELAGRMSQRGGHAGLTIVAGRDTPADRLLRSPLWGLVQAIALEQPALQASLVASDDAAALAAELLADRFEPHVRFFDGVRQVARLAAAGPVATGTMLVADPAGTLDGVSQQAAEAKPPAPDEVAISVRRSGLNFRDVLIALGSYPEAAELGCECVGEVTAVGKAVTRVKAGDRVMAIGAACFTDRINVPQALVATLPQGIEWDAAASLPVAYATAARALIDLAGLSAADSVLIHSATGGVGQAAIQIARDIGAKVYASSSRTKWPALTRLGVSEPLDSRDTAFGAQLMRQTADRGVDVVLNSLPGEFRQLSVDVLAAGGRFVEIGKGDGITPEAIAKRRPDISHHVLDLSRLSAQQPEVVGELLERVRERVEAEAWQPLPVRTYAFDDAAQALREMQQARHVGKLVLKPVGTANPDSITVHGDGSYLVTGGFGALGLRVAQWLVERGAGEILLLGRDTTLSDEQADLISQLRDRGATITSLAADVSDAEQLADRLAPWLARTGARALRGVVHAAGTLDDGLLSELDWSRVHKVLAPKLDGGWHLHQLTRELPLDFFVLFSSAAGVLGAPGQSNHAAANSFLDGLAEYRHALGLPALSLAWGPWSDIGAALRYADGNALSALPGVGMISPAAGLEHLSRVWTSARPSLAIVPLDAARLADQSLLPAQPFFAGILAAASRGAGKSVSGGAGEFLATLQATPVTGQRALLDEHICQSLARVLGMDPARLDRTAGLFDLGLDSLTALELKNSLQNDLAVTLPNTLIFDYPTLELLLEHLAERVLVAPASPAESPADDELASQLDKKLDEVDALLDEANKASELRA